MDQALRPHRGGTVLALGILSLISGFFLVPLGILAWIMGSRDLRAMNRGELDGAGRSLTQVGWVFGIAASVLWLVSAAGAAVVFGMRPVIEATERVHVSTPSPGVRTIENHDKLNRLEWWQEAQQSDGSWVKQGFYFLRSPEGVRLEAGSYREGKREGEWTFRDENGIVDESRSGIYENDVRVQSGPTPPGDYPVEKLRLQR